MASCKVAGKDPVGWVIDYNPFITTLGKSKLHFWLSGLSWYSDFSSGTGVKASTNAQVLCGSWITCGSISF